MAHHKQVTISETMSRLAEGPVFVVIRFPLARYQACKNSLAKNYSVHRNYSGAVSGLSKEIQVVEGQWPRGRGVAILSFASFREAELWKDSVPEIRQHDWMDGVDLVMVPITSLPPEKKRFVIILDLNFYDFDQFLREYSNDTNSYLEHSGAAGGVVATDVIYKVKGLWDPSFLVMNFWSSPEEFDMAYTSDAYQPLKQKRLMLADTNSVVFALDPLFDRFA